MKICSKCKLEKDLKAFGQDINKKDKLYSSCNECRKKYYIENKEYIINQQEKYIKKNYKKIQKQKKKYYIENKKVLSKSRKIYLNSRANYNTYAEQIFWAKDPVRNIDGKLQTRCTYCGKWYFPTIISVRNRIQSLKGQTKNRKGVECRLYCSTECKQACPIYRKIKFQEGHPLKNENSSREVQPELRQMVFKRDEYACIKCGKHKDELDVPIHCHHIEGIRYNPLESADIDMCVTVCKICHNKIHSEDGCGYNDMKCKTGEI